VFVEFGLIFVSIILDAFNEYTSME